jgi:hypothetical protein
VGEAWVVAMVWARTREAREARAGAPRICKERKRGVEGHGQRALGFGQGIGEGRAYFHRLDSVEGFLDSVDGLPLD